MAKMEGLTSFATLFKGCDEDVKKVENNHIIFHREWSRKVQISLLLFLFYILKVIQCYLNVNMNYLNHENSFSMRDNVNTEK